MGPHAGIRSLLILLAAAAALGGAGTWALFGILKSAAPASVVAADEAAQDDLGRCMVATATVPWQRSGRPGDEPVEVATASSPWSRDAGTAATTRVATARTPWVRDWRRPQPAAVPVASVPEMPPRLRPASRPAARRG